MRLRRSLAPLVLAAAVVGAATSHAAVQPQIVDPKGDAIGLQGMHDIVSTTFEITKTVKKVGKKTVATPKALVVTMKLGAAPSPAPGTHYGVVASTDCGAFGLGASIYALGGTSYKATGSFFECGPEEDVAGVILTTFRVAPVLTLGPDSITWMIPYKGLPKEITVGDQFFDLTAYTAPADPVFGIDTQTFTSIFGADTVLDLAKGESAKLS